MPGRSGSAPPTRWCPAARRYLPGTMILETSWGTDRGWVIVRDVLLVGPWHDTDERSTTHRRAPTDYDADHVLLRTVRCVNGSVEIQLECDPIFDYGRRYAHWEYVGDGYSEAVATAEGWPTKLTLTTDLRVGFEGSRVRALTTLHDGDTAFVALAFSDHAGPKTYPEAYDRLVKTADYWHQWLAHGTFPDHPWRQYLQRSALTLKGLTYSPTGAMIAAATTSLPETPGGVRNWDYRYSWVRDSTFMLWGLHSLGFEWEANDYFYFMQDVAQADDLQVMYGIQGERELIEDTLDHLSRLRQRPPRADRQRRLQPAPARRVGHDAGLDLPAREVARPPARAPLAADRAARRGRDRELEAARPRHLGGPRRGQALRLLEGHVLGRVRSRRPARAAAGGARARRALAGARRRDQGRHHRARLQGRRLHAALRDRRRWTRARC